jgi:acyl carrier protein
VDEEKFGRFKKCVVEVLSVDEAAVVPDAKFGDDLDADSLDLVELVMALEEEFDVSVPEEELEGIETVGQAYELVAGKRPFTGSGPRPKRSVDSTSSDDRSTYSRA